MNAKPAAGRTPDSRAGAGSPSGGAASSTNSQDRPEGAQRPEFDWTWDARADVWPGIYWNPDADFVTLCAGGEQWTTRNRYVRYGQPTPDAEGEYRRIARLLGLPLFRLRCDARRRRPYRWEEIT